MNSSNLDIFYEGPHSKNRHSSINQGGLINVIMADGIANIMMKSEVRLPRGVIDVTLIGASLRYAISRSGMPDGTRKGFAASNSVSR